MWSICDTASDIQFTEGRMTLRPPDQRPPDHPTNNHPTNLTTPAFCCIMTVSQKMTEGLQ
jgi:hypothetical protein